MVTAVDSSILLDVLTDDPNYSGTSFSSLSAARTLGAVIACPVVWAEMRGFFTDGAIMDRAFADAGILFDPFDRECAEVAGQHWSDYRRQGGSRTRLIPDFLIGAHARVRGGRLLTRDRGFFRNYFAGLDIVGEGA